MQIRDAVPSPDGKNLAFTVLNRLYAMDYPNGPTKRLTTQEFTEAERTWSNDVTWTGKGGDFMKINVAGKPVIQKLNKETEKKSIGALVEWKYEKPIGNTGV